MEPYRSFFPHAGLLLPETEKISNRVLVLPTGTSISSDDIHKIAQIIRYCVNNGLEISQKFQSKNY